MNNDYLFKSETAVCIIPKVQKFQIGYKAYMTDKEIYLIHRGASAFTAILFQALGGILFRVWGEKKIKAQEKATEEKRAGMSIDSIVEQDPKSIKIDYSQIEKYEVKKGLFNAGQDFSGKAKGVIKPIILYVNGQKHFIYLTEEEQAQAVKVLETRCPKKME